MADRVVCFSSASKQASGLYALSNLAHAPFTLTWPDDDSLEDFPPFLRGCTCAYTTSEHAYQATRALDLHTARQFESDGAVALSAFRRWPVRRGVVKDLYAAKVRHWGAKAPGIVAKMVTTLQPGLAEQALGLRLKARGAGLGCWPHILRAKFEQNEAPRRVLLGTAPATLVEQARFPRASNYWAAFVRPDGTLVGQNTMGRLVQAERARLLRALE
jgi:hypothetical protein